MTWDTTVPAATRALSLGDDDIREFKTDVQGALRAQDTEGVEAVFPGTDSSAPVYRPRLPRGSTASRPSASANQGLYINTDTNALQRCDDSNWVDVASLVPPGTISAYGGASAPGGWLLCDGSAVSRTTYANLYTAIGDAFGEGNGSTTFNLPDLRGQFLRGVDGGAGTDPDADDRTAMATGGNTGDSVGSIQADATALANTSMTGTAASGGGHTHSMHIPDTAYAAAAASIVVQSMGTNQSAAQTNVAGLMETGGAHTHTTTITGGGDNETRPTNAGVNFIIKY